MKEISVRKNIVNKGLTIISEDNFDYEYMIDLTDKFNNKGIYIEDKIVISYKGYAGKEYSIYDFFNDGTAISHFKYNENKMDSLLILNEATLPENSYYSKNGLLSTYNGISYERFEFYNGININDINYIDFGYTDIDRSYFIGRNQNIVFSTWCSLFKSEETIGTFLNYGFTGNSGFKIEAIREDIGFKIRASKSYNDSYTFVDNKGNEINSNIIYIDSELLEYNKVYHIVVYYKSDGNIKIYINSILDNYLTEYNTLGITYSDYIDLTHNITMLGEKSINGDVINTLYGIHNNTRFFTKANFEDINALGLFNEGI